MVQIKEWQARLFLILIISLLLFLRFPDFFQSPNTMVIEPYGDGHKAYTTIFYHAKYDKSYSHFEGMNYPYGEHVVPAATQPLLSNAIKFVSNNIVDITDYTIAIVNFSILLTLLLSGFFLYLIFRELDLPHWYCILVAIALSFFAPQFVRFKAHYGLAHMETLPILIYLMMRFDVRRGIARSFWIAMWLFLISQIHFYFFAIMVFTISFYFLFDFTRKWPWKKLHKYALHYGIQVILPLIFFFFWMYYDDPVTDRTDAPWGFFHYRAYLEGIFTSMAEPHFQWFSKNVIEIRSIGTEGRAYIGLCAMVVLLILLVQWARKLFKEPFLQIESKYTPFLNRMFYAALCILLFSLGLPFVIPGLEGLLDFTGPIRQFRSIGRFAWVFYYVMNIIAFFWLYRKADALNSKAWKTVLLTLALGLLIYETYHFSLSKDIKLDKIDEMQAGQKYTDGLQIDYDKYQAVLTVPHYNIGSDNFWWHLGGFIAQKSLTLSMQTGLPVTSAMLTRTSLSHTYNQIQLVTEPYRLPPILDAYPNDKPLLMAWDENTFQKEKERYAHLQEGALLLYEKEPLRLYELPLETFQKRIDQRKQIWQLEMEAVDTLYAVDGFLSTEATKNFTYLNFDDQAADQTYLGNGAFQGTMNTQNVIFDGAIPQQQTDSSYTLSFWMFLRSDLNPRSKLSWVEYKPDDSTVLQEHKTEARYWTKVFDSNGWVLLETNLKLKSADSHLKLTIQNDPLGKEALFVDELLIQPKGQDLYKKQVEFLWKNNRWFPN